jgi:PIN domain nuclease of toxin-antitoxin system
VNVLLDTHVFIWLDSKPEKLSKLALDICQDRTNELHLSMVSIWEMQIKNQLGKLHFEVPISEMVNVQKQENDLRIMGIEMEHIFRLKDLPAHHNDPFDRLLLSQSLENNIPIISADTKFEKYSEVTVLW